VRLRSFNAVGNSTFEVDQINVGNTVANANGKVLDRWQLLKSGTMVASGGQNSVAGGINWPGTSFAITRSFFRVTLTTAAASLATGDYLIVRQILDGPQWRELQNDVHSLQVLVRSSIANLIVGCALEDGGTPTTSLVNPLNLGAANTWTLLTLPNLPVWPAGNFSNAAGAQSYYLVFCLAAGSSKITSANGSWQNGYFFGAIGQSNFAATLNATFDVAFVQHEPGAFCSTPIDCPFGENLDDCLRYYQKSQYYPTPPNTASNGFFGTIASPNTTFVMPSILFPKRLVKLPNVAIYDANNSNLSSVYNVSTGAHTGSGTVPVTDSAILYLNLATAQAAGNIMQFNWVVDTTW
jgi:hypothetical protein